MIWMSLLIFAISFIATALLAPKPEFENARPEELDPNNFPQATEDAPVGLVLGCVKISGPNTLWYGDFKSIAIKEKVKTGLFSSTRVTVGYNYYLSIDLGICLGPAVKLKKIFIDDTEVKDGASLYPTQVVTYFEDLTMSISTSALIYEETDLLAATGLDAAAFDALAAAGELTFEAICEFTSEKTPLAGGGPSSGSYVIDSGYHTVSGDILGSAVIPIEGPLSLTDSDIGTTIAMKLELNNTVPVGARYLSLAVQLSPTLILFTILTVTDQSYSVTGLGEVIDAVTSNINEPELYGGRKSGGGHVGNFTFYDGAFDQDIDPDVELSVGVDNVPAYNGICHIVMPNQWIGETPALRKTEFLIGKYSNYLGLPFLGHITLDGDDINPAEALYHMAVDGWSGLGLETSKLNFSSFFDAGITLLNEGHGCSIKVTSPQTGKKIFQEVLRQIDGILSQNSDGEIELKLIRNDYVASSLPVYDEDDIMEVTKFTKTSWQDVKSVVKVSFATRTKEGTRVAEAQNMAIARMVGKKNVSEVTFPFCYDVTIANQLAARELSVLSTPLIRVTLIMNRNAFDLSLGDPVKISIPEYGVSELIVRVQNLDLGLIDDNKISVEFVQDVFAVGTVVFGEPADTGWSDNRPVPEDVATSSIVDMPYFFGQGLEDIVEDGFGAVIPFPVSPKLASNSFDFLIGVVSGTLDIWEPQQVSYPLSGLLQTSYSRDTGFLTGVDATGITIKTLVGADGSDPLSATTVQIQAGEAGLLYVGNEWMAYEGVVDNLDATFTLTNVHRGLFGTLVADHLGDDRIYFFNTDLLGLSSIGAILLEDGTIYYKILDRVGATAQGETSVTEGSYVLQDVADRPLRPRNMELDADRIIPKVPNATMSLTWDPSNRAEGKVSFELDGAEVPDQTEEYDVEVWVDGVEDVSFNSTNISEPHVMDLTILGGSTAEVRLYARRSGGDTKSSLYYARFPVKLSTLELLSGDMQDTGDDVLLTSGDMQSGDDAIKISGDEV